MAYVNHAKRYLDALRQWRKSGMPNSAMSGLDKLWNKLTKTEKFMTAKFIAWELLNERDNSDQNP